MSTNHNSLLNQLIPGISAGLVIGITELIFAISLGALIYSGQSSYLANGIGLVLLGSLPPLILMSFFSSYRGSLSMPQDAPAAIMAVTATGILQSLSNASPREKFVTVVAILFISTLLTGLTYLLLGQYRLGSLVRFLPYPVVGGFLASTGWLLVIGGIGVMSNVSFSFANPGALFHPDLYLRWVPGLVLGFVMLLVLNRYNHFLILPGLLLGISILFYIVAFLNQTPVSILITQGWILGPFRNANFLQMLPFSDIGLIHWNAILAQAGGIASIVMISTVSLLLNASGLELVVRQDLDLNRELRIMGWGNIIGSFLGGSVSYLTLSTTKLNHRIGKGSPISGFVTAALYTLPLFFGAAALSFVPRIMLGSLLVMFGLSFLYEWIYQSWSKFSRVEYAVIVLILVTSATLGYLQGVGIGIVAAVVLFVINYSRVNVTKHALSGAELQSRFNRSPDQRRVLIEQGDRTFILQLQGFIFFGTANKLLEQVRSRIARTDLLPLQYLVLDFTKVTGLDSTAMLSFSKMKQNLQDRKISILITAPSKVILNQFEEGGFVTNNAGTPKAFLDLDHGLEWVEENVLRTENKNFERNLTLEEILLQLLPQENQKNDLFKYLEKKELNTGDYLMHQGDAADNIYFVESGQVTAQLEHPNQPPVRLESMKSGHVIGELGFYLGQTRTAAVVADEPGIVYQLSAENLAKMEENSPEVASYFHRLIIHLMAERTTHLIRTVAALEQ